MKTDSSKLLLLDVNVLVALAWPNHQMHAAAVRAMEVKRTKWATCALTQLGFLRISSNPAAVPGPRSPAECVALLETMVSDPLHVYLDRLPATTGLTIFRGLLGHNQITDAYLLHLARENHAVFLTFDKRLLSLVAPDQLVQVLS